MKKFVLIFILFVFLWPCSSLRAQQGGDVALQILGEYEGDKHQLIYWLHKTPHEGVEIQIANETKNEKRILSLFDGDQLQFFSGVFDLGKIIKGTDFHFIFSSQKISYIQTEHLRAATGMTTWIPTKSVVEKYSNLEKFLVGEINIFFRAAQLLLRQQPNPTISSVLGELERRVVEYTSQTAPVAPKGKLATTWGKLKGR